LVHLVLLSIPRRAPENIVASGQTGFPVTGVGDYRLAGRGDRQRGEMRVARRGG